MHSTNWVSVAIGAQQRSKEGRGGAATSKVQRQAVSSVHHYHVSSFTPLPSSVMRQPSSGSDLDGQGLRTLDPVGWK